MSAILVTLLSLPAAAPPAAGVETLFVKVGPNALVPGRSAGQDRAVVLMHGLSVNLISKEKVLKPRLRVWQQADSTLVKQLGRDSDVYAFAYSQTVACDQVCEQSRLLFHLRTLKAAGYKEIVLVGHSAGGVIARHLIEDHPAIGVTKVVQVCAPNTGSGLAALKAARAVQAAFLNSLTRGARAKVLEGRTGKRIPAACEFVCVVSTVPPVGSGDGVVAARSQWSPDLQEQGVPAHGMRGTHWEATRTTRGADLIARLVRDRTPRWDDKQVAEARKKLLRQ